MGGCRPARPAPNGVNDLAPGGDAWLGVGASRSVAVRRGGREEGGGRHDVQTQLGAQCRLLPLLPLLPQMAAFILDLPSPKG